MLELVKLRVCAALAFVTLMGPPVLSQPRAISLENWAHELPTPVMPRVRPAIEAGLIQPAEGTALPMKPVLCIVDTKPNSSSQYDPSAGPYAMAMYQQLARTRLRSGALLHVTVLPASMQQDILPEVHRLDCSWVLQLWYQRSTDYDAYGKSQPRSLLFGSLLFTLWNGTTRKVIERGAGFVSEGKLALTPYAVFAKQILKKLNQVP
jgi:hypothetical protein